MSDVKLGLAATYFKPISPYHCQIEKTKSVLYLLEI